MSSSYLLCRHQKAQVLVPASDVLAVRELAVHDAPPLAHPWVGGVALGEDTVIVVVDPAAESMARASEADVQRLVLLRPRGDGRSLHAVLVDEIVDIRTVDCGELRTLAELPWLAQASAAKGTLVVDPECLHDLLVGGGVA